MPGAEAVLRPALAQSSRAAASSLVLVLAVLAAYANAVEASFQFDDWDVIVRDPRVQSLGAWWESMPGIRPLLKLSYALNHESGLGAAGFHGVNVLIHTVNACLVGALLRLRLAGWPPYVAFIGALIFALHPVQTEAVTYASGRSMSLGAFFALASLWAWAAGRERNSRLLVHLASPLLMVAAVATRETMLILPAALWLWAATDPIRPSQWRSVLKDTAVHVLLLLLAIGVVLAWPRYRDLVALGLGLRAPGENLLVQLEAIRYLLGQLLWVNRLNADPMLPASAALTAADVGTLAGLLAAAVLALRNVRRHPQPSFGVLWFLLWLVPTNSVLARLDVVNDRQLYVALIGPALLLATGVAWILQRMRRPGRGIAAVIVLTVLVGWGIATHLRNRVYASELAYWSDVVGKTPASSRARNNLGMALAAECRLDEARREWLAAFRQDPANVRAAVNVQLVNSGRLPAGLAHCPPERWAGVGRAP